MLVILKFLVYKKYYNVYWIDLTVRGFDEVISDEGFSHYKGFFALNE